MKLSAWFFKTAYTSLAGLGLVGILLFIALCFLSVVAGIAGLVLAFKASIVLGIISLFVEPAFVVYGLVYLFAGINLPAQIMAWVHTL